MADNIQNDPSNQSPVGPPSDDVPPNPNAADLIRQKVARIYEEEPGAKEELAEVERINMRSKHQEFMHKLANSGKDLAAIQTEWHNYYQNLTDEEKSEVWQEFYYSQPLLSRQPEKQPVLLADNKQPAPNPVRPKSEPKKSNQKRLRDVRKADEIKTVLAQKVTAGGKLKPKHHLQSLLFGLGLGTVVIVIFLFGFFNEVFIAPFIQPSRVSSSTPLIVSSDQVAATSTPEVIIPKINVEIPADYNQTSTDENVIENALESGVVHYPNTSFPGQTGNAAFFGHSSNNIFNKGKYKFAFVLLHTLVQGDTFYLTYNNKVYVYKVISRNIVDPSDVGVLGPVAGQTATATLITCDPPGTSLHRLIVVGQQISPDPTANTAASTARTSAAPPAQLPGNGPTLLGKFIRSFLGKTLTLAVFATAFWFVYKWVNQPKQKLA